MVVNFVSSLSGAKRSRRDWVSNFLSSFFLHPSQSFDFPFGSAQDAYGVECRQLPERSKAQLHPEGTDGRRELQPSLRTNQTT